MGRLNLAELVQALRWSESFINKSHIRVTEDSFSDLAKAFNIRNGDDAAAVRDGEGYLLLAAEGIHASIVRSNPYLAGKCSVLANVNDIYAMGGRPLAMVDVIGTPREDAAKEICRGMRDNAVRFNVPIVGGHLLRTEADFSVALAILGKAKRLLTSFDAKPGDRIALVTKQTGLWLENHGFWNCTLECDDSSLIPNLELLPLAAEAGLAAAAKDVSMAGISGTVVMLAESSRIGARIDLDKIVPPHGVEMLAWLLAFMSYGFVLAVAPERMAGLTGLFANKGLSVTDIGCFQDDRRVVLALPGEQAVLWDFEREPFVGSGAL